MANVRVAIVRKNGVVDVTKKGVADVTKYGVAYVRVAIVTQPLPSPPIPIILLSHDTVETQFQDMKILHS